MKVYIPISKLTVDSILDICMKCAIAFCYIAIMLFVIVVFTMMGVLFGSIVCGYSYTTNFYTMIYDIRIIIICIFTNILGLFLFNFAFEIVEFKFKNDEPVQTKYNSEIEVIRDD
jgi:hypothetical protein